jgi:hypothetical protein
MVEAISRFVTDQLVTYDNSVSRDQANPPDRWNVEARIIVAMAIFEVIEGLDRRLAQVTEPDPVADRALSNRIRDLYATWERPAAKIVPQLKALWKQGVTVDGGDAFADAVLEARSMLSISLEELDERAAQLRRGEKRTMAEVMDGVRRRLGA